MANRRKTRLSPEPVIIEQGTATLTACEVPFEIRLEARRNTRYSLTQRKAYLRMPNQTSAEEVRTRTLEFKTWLADAVARRPALAAAHQTHRFNHGESWALGPYHYQIRLEEAALRGASARLLQPGLVRVRLPEDTPAKQRSELVEKLLYRIAANQATPEVVTLIEQVNQAHFRVEVGRLKLSPTRSRWGSCSGRGTISLSSRLLAAPEDCLRAVIVHELAHRIEMNHSDRFWTLVYGAMPDYDRADDWLKTKGGELGWKPV